MVATLLVLAGLTAVLVVGAIGGLRLRRRGRVVAGFLLALALPPGLLSGYLGVRLIHGVPDPAEQDIAEGAEYRRYVFATPAVAHVLTLEREHFQFRLAAADAEASTARSATTSLEEVGGLAAINGSFFAPFHDNHLLSYYPHEGDPSRPIGYTVVGGRRLAYIAPAEEWVTIFVGPDVSLRPGQHGVESALSGRRLLVEDGVAVPHEDHQRYARSVLAFNDDHVFFVVVDGKQPRYSIGMHYAELSDFLLSLGAHTAVELDGGGSAHLAVRVGEQTRSLSRPCHTQIPGRERPVVNHIVAIPRR